MSALSVKLFPHVSTFTVIQYPCMNMQVAGTTVARFRGIKSSVCRAPVVYFFHRYDRRIVMYNVCVVLRRYGGERSDAAAKQMKKHGLMENGERKKATK